MLAWSAPANRVRGLWSDSGAWWGKRPAVSAERRGAALVPLVPLSLPGCVIHLGRCPCSAISVHPGISPIPPARLLTRQYTWRAIRIRDRDGWSSSDHLSRATRKQKVRGKEREREIRDPCQFPLRDAP